ncbi:hypothetical protein [Nocardia aurantia]|uniref:Uncharacterized protein n=1 Tax=Nocardia aurantia TaxID=2585199 RepID=A0A7K0DK60_9NOCA|nr:hypothetical protein [Nocardia aurantia]MQY26193.1 hypothetical protein [Nocardia aurantia]
MRRVPAGMRRHVPAAVVGLVAARPVGTRGAVQPRDEVGTTTAARARSRRVVGGDLSTAAYTSPPDQHSTLGS